MTRLVFLPAFLALAAVSFAATFAARDAAAIVPATETVCDDCVDDDEDGDVDREDSDCPAPADGGILGLGDPEAAKAAFKCEKALQKAGAKFAVSKLKSLHKCANAVFACVQLKNGDAACLAKARATCEKSLGRIAGQESKLEAAIVKACGPDRGLDLDDLRSVVGLGYEAEETACGTFQDVQEIATCVRVQHECKVERLLAAGVPRMAELFGAIGVNAEDVLPCLDELPAADGGGAGLPAPIGKAAVKCQQSFTKAGVKLVTAAAKTISKCIDAAFKCIQTKPGDQACLTKAIATCDKLDGKLRGVNGTIAKLVVKTNESCTKTGISNADFRSVQGLGFTAIAPRCSALNPFLNPDSVAGAVQCVGLQHLCDGSQMVERQVPRARSLADFLGISLDL